MHGSPFKRISFEFVYTNSDSTGSEENNHEGPILVSRNKSQNGSEVPDGEKNDPIFVLALVENRHLGRKIPDIENEFRTQNLSALGKNSRNNTKPVWGHIISKRFGGEPTKRNLIPLWHKVNCNHRTVENKIYDFIKNDENHCALIIAHVYYNDLENQSRPTVFHYDYILLKKNEKFKFYLNSGEDLLITIRNATVVSTNYTKFFNRIDDKVDETNSDEDKKEDKKPPKASGDELADEMGNLTLNNPDKSKSK